MSQGKLRVVFDVNVYIDAIAQADSTYPLLQAIPPVTSNASADCLSLALDAADFELYVSPHILTNVSRVFIEGLGLNPKLVGSILNTITEIVHFSGGSVLEPARSNHDQKDFEDNLVLDLVRQTEALVLVTSDAELVRQSPWNGRLILSPHHFVSQVIRTRNI